MLVRNIHVLEILNLIITFMEIPNFIIFFAEAPILQVERSLICKQHDAIEIACNAIGGMSIVDFGLWTHLHGGYFIRYLQGFKDGNTSTIKLTNCSYEDEGDYFCSAWSSDHGISLWNNISSNVIIQGKYIQFNKSLVRHTD